MKQYYQIWTDIYNYTEIIQLYSVLDLSLFVVFFSILLLRSLSCSFVAVLFHLVQFQFSLYNQLECVFKLMHQCSAMLFSSLNLKHRNFYTILMQTKRKLFLGGSLDIQVFEETRQLTELQKRFSTLNRPLVSYFSPTSNL